MTKVDAGSFNAFSSPNLAPLATAEVDISSNANKIHLCLCNLMIKEKKGVIIFLLFSFSSQLGHRMEGKHDGEISSQY